MQPDEVITEIRVKNLRTLSNVRIGTSGLSVIIGANGSGKSSLIEACEILHKIPSPDFASNFNGIHGGLPFLLRNSTQELSLGVSLRLEGNVYNYDISIRPSANTLINISKEILTAGTGNNANRIFERTADGSIQLNPVQRVRPNSNRVGEQHPALVHLSSEHNSIFARISNIIRLITVYLLFDIKPVWISTQFKDRNPSIRGNTSLEAISALDMLGRNLANAYSRLKNEYGSDHWLDTMKYVRLGLGDIVESINLIPAPQQQGRIALWIKYYNSNMQISTDTMSDGMLTYLCIVALYRLGSPKSLLALEEPELHLHPHLLGIVIDLLQSMSNEYPVLITTHSDRILDSLKCPAESAILCELDRENNTNILRPDKAMLDKWLQDYRGLGDLRSSGHDKSIFANKTE